MSDYRDGDRVTTTRTDYTTDHGPRRVEVNETYHERRGGGGIGRWLLILLALAAIIAAILFATGFWRVNTSGELRAPDVDVSVKGGEVPNVDLDSKKIEVGTKKETIEVPKVETEKETIEVPVVGVSEGKTDKK